MTTARNAMCKFPGCLDAVAQRTGRPGRPYEFCENPDHTSTALFQINKKRSQRAAARQPATPGRPVSARVDTLAGLVRRIEELVGDELPALLADAGELVGAIGDPASLAQEIAKCDAKVAEADAARADAERQTDQAVAERDAAITAQELAEDAADEAVEARDAALEEVEQTVRETRQQLSKMQALLDAARNAKSVAESERDAAIRTAEARIAEVGRLRTDLDDERRSAQQRLDQLHAAHVEDIAAVRSAADKTVADMRAQNAADMAAVRADAEKVRAELRHDLEAAHAELNSLRRTGEFVSVPQNSRKGFRAT